MKADAVEAAHAVGREEELVRPRRERRHVRRYLEKYYHRTRCTVRMNGPW